MRRPIIAGKGLSKLKRGNILGSLISAEKYDRILNTLTGWAQNRESRYVCICNVHSVVTAYFDPAFRNILNSADTAAPDGMPLVWALRKMGFSGQNRVDGPSLMLSLCERAVRDDLKIYLYGSTDNTLRLLKQNLLKRYPGLQIAGYYAPPFRELSPEEAVAETEMINESGANIVFAGIGCPKQENWIAKNRGRINAVMIGVGAAFDFHAGTIKRAPLWMRKNGLEWVHRLCSEPRRLWKRYLQTNTAFMFLFLLQVTGLKKF